MEGSASQSGLKELDKKLSDEICKLRKEPKKATAAEPGDCERDPFNDTRNKSEYKSAAAKSGIVPSDRHSSV